MLSGSVLTPAFIAKSTTGPENRTRFHMPGRVWPWAVQSLFAPCGHGPRDATAEARGCHRSLIRGDSSGMASVQSVATTGLGLAWREAPSARRRRWERRLVPAAFLAPVVIYALAFFAYPLAYGILISFEKYGFAQVVKGKGPFIGLGNYTAAFADPVTLDALRNTAIFTVASVLCQAGIGLAIAQFLNRPFWLSGVLRRLVLAPWLIPLVATGTIFAELFSQNGLVNIVLRDAHLVREPVQWLIEYSPAMTALILVNIWAGLPFNIIVFYAGLQDVDPVLYEAGRTDGASAWQRFRFITLPQLRAVTAIVLMLGTISTVKVFDLVIIMTDGGPDNATQLLSTWSYTQAFTNFNFGMGAAIGNILLVISLIVTVVYVRGLRKA